jgi:hypothetical protein
MSRNRDITKDDLNKALEQMARNAMRENKALGLETLYKKNGYLVKLDSSGKEHILKKLGNSQREHTSRVFTFE